MIGWLPPILAAIYLGALLVVGGSPSPSDASGLARFADHLEESFRRQSLVLFPAGVVTSIATVLALLRHMNLRSARGRLQGLALASLFGSGILWATIGGSSAEAAVAAARAGYSADLAAALSTWRSFETVVLALAVVVVASLVAAERMPLVYSARGSLAELTPRHRTLLFLLGAATLFEGYDRFIVSLALPYIGDDLGAEEGTLGIALSLIRVGALASIVLGRLADRHGRRRMLLFTILAYTLATAATGLSRGIVEFVLFQLFATIFLVTELSLAQVVVTEEFPARFRAQGQGILGAFAALGSGLAALLFPVFQASPLGWRGLYFLGILPLLLIAWLRRALPETTRWTEARARGETRDIRFTEVLAPRWRRRFLVLVAVAMAMTASAGPAFAFASYRATKAFDWSPADVSVMILIGGGLGLAGWFVFGVLAERLGRRVVGVLGLLGGGAATITFYGTEALFPAFAVLVFMEAGAQIALNALGTELFPTRLRGTAKAWITNAWILGAMIGLAIVGSLSGPLGGADPVVTLLGFLPVLACPLLLSLPESRGRELEELESPPAA